jgi:hypothetical protein
LINYRKLLDTLTRGQAVIKAFCEIAPLDMATASVMPGQGAVNAD